MKKHCTNRWLSLLLVVTMLAGFAAPTNANATDGKIRFTQVDNSTVSVDLLNEAPEQEIHTMEYVDSDVVRVSIILEERSTLEAGYATRSIAENAEAMTYRTALRKDQDAITAAIEKKTGEALDVVWNLTLAANIISANVKYGQIAQIEAIPGIKSVVIETLYQPDVAQKHLDAEPNMATSSAQIGSGAAWAAGYTGAGSRIAVIDTGADVNHMSFDPAAFEYSLAYQAERHGMTAEAYLDTLDLLDAEEIAAAAEHLNVSIDAEQSCINTKVAFGYNYVDKDYDVIHMNDSAGEHGSHVAGIATANAFVPDGNGSFVPALENVFAQGVAPDAQLLVMKVFGKNGGAYESDYMAAIEDAIILGADSVNLSLGSGNPGTSKCAIDEYQAILEEITRSGTVVTMSAGNSGTWVENAYNSGYLYADDVSMQTDGSPGSYTSALTTASVDNDGVVGAYVAVGGNAFTYTETYYTNEPFATLAGEQEYVFIDGYGSYEDWASIGDALAGKIALCVRGGGYSFFEKAEEAVNAGAIGTFIYNNTDGVLNMNLAAYSKTAPVASLTKADAAAIKAASAPVADENGNVLYYTGTMTVSSGMSVVQKNSPYYTMSKFSSWGVPGSLELKPEITAPGGSIYSVYGEVPGAGGYDQYVYMSGTSMAAPQTAGMAALVAQYIREEGLDETTGLSARHLAQSLLMSTAVPMIDGNSGVYYPVLQQGAGLANVAAAISSDSYILMAEDANAGAADGKIKVELGDDPQRTGAYSFTFTIHNLTNAEKAFALSADFFTQDVFEDYANGNYSEDELAAYMDLLGTWLAAEVTWTADGAVLEPSGELSGLDFDGSGSVNTADGRKLLEHVVDPTVVLEHAQLADLDFDGDVDSHDAYLFFKELTFGSVLVAPNGTIDVEVEIRLTEDQKAALNADYPSGAYVQGYVFAESLADAEGVEGTSHSIPVLGFYGNWTDASMYDVGTYQEYATGEEFRAPYLERENANAYLITYVDEPDNTYYFGGNPLVPDETYLPERNAINGVNGDRISLVHFTAIRNAAASRFTAVNKTTGEVYGESELGEVASAFFYESSGYWMNTQYTMNTNVKPIDVPEGEVIELSLTLAPEYYVDDDGLVDWDALGEGAHLAVPMVVDNTAPVLKSVALDFMNNTLKITASDNEYVAAVGLFNKSGTQAYGLAGAKHDIEKDTDAEYVLDLNGISGKRFLVQVFDYAMNASTYLIEMQMGDQVDLPEMIAYDRTGGHWTHFTKDSRYDYSTGMPVYEETDLVFYAATIVDHMILASTENGDLYVIPEDDLSDMTYVNNMGAVVTDMAYNRADGNVYGVADGNLVIIDKRSGLLTSLGKIGVNTTTLACDADGNFYCHLDGSSAVYTFTLETLAEPAVLVQEIYCEELYQALNCSDVQAMEINPNNGMLCWSSLFVWSAWWSYSYYVEINPADGSYTLYNDLVDEFTALIIPEKSASGGDDWTSPTDQVEGVSMSMSEMTMLRNTQKSLAATVYPWSATDRTVTWSTSDASIATVDNNGLVTARSAGTATITATSNLDPSVSASCTVTVEILDVTIQGMLQDENGVAEFFTWNMATEDTWTAGKEIDTDMTAAALNPNDGTYYVMDSARDIWAMHKVDRDGVTIANSGANANKLPLWDMAYSTYFSEVKGQDMIAGIYDYYVLLPKDPMNLDMRVFDMYWYLDELVGITSLGYEPRYDDWYGVQRDTEHFMLLDDYGYVYDLWVYEDNDTMGAMIDYRESDLVFDFVGYENLYKYTSLMACEDGALYVSAFNGETNELYRMTYNEAEGIYNAVRFADVGQDVWPAIITEVNCNAPAEQEPEAVRAFPASAKRMEAKSMTMNELAMADAEIADGEKTVTVNVTTGVAATNGLATVTYDASKLTLERATVASDYTAEIEKEGEITFAYVSMTEIPAEGTVATLTFRVLEAVDSQIHVEHRQVNNQTGSSDVLTVNFTHPNTEIRNAVDATCTEEGYTGDVWCLECGMKVRDGEIIPALGHDWHGTGCSRCGEKRENPFVDVPDDSFYIDSVLWAVEKGITTGIDATHFGPGLACSRAQAVTFLWRSAGSPEPEISVNPFVDVTEEDFYYKAVLWAMEKGITNGIDATHFGPLVECSRAQIVTFLWRAEGKPAVFGENPFTDVEVGSFYAEAVLWAAQEGISTGLTDTTFGPNTICNRAQIVTFLYRAYA